MRDRGEINSFHAVFLRAVAPLTSFKGHLGSFWFTQSQIGGQYGDLMPAQRKAMRERADLDYWTTSVLEWEVRLNCHQNTHSVRIVRTLLAVRPGFRSPVGAASQKSFQITMSQRSNPDLTQARYVPAHFQAREIDISVERFRRPASPVPNEVLRRAGVDPEIEPEPLRRSREPAGHSLRPLQCPLS